MSTLRTIDYQETMIHHNVTIDKYGNNQIKEEFSFLDSNYSNIQRITKEIMIEIAEKIIENKSVSIKVNDGWSDMERKKMGSGMALKITLNNNIYEITFYIGVAGEKFDEKMIKNKIYLKIDENILNELCKYLIYNEQIRIGRDMHKKDKRHTLTLE
ncbi:hypothetical protein [Aliarcobacter cryaerophilus]|uniref:hypothetical protein n=1 Tax=Aliarcobacter cryaerophilus TaxID=28198 RepID=UPI0021B3E128|nr:hypothetical protein [Aliarcobacter cryaerophilus]MCT7405242.1 hypothetical protein [Aliarcobacter cryaerophilus]MCT7431753.1 hypothetical protein [Aliarcobacter cryaerophilus]MCT7502717.1 hypothetical protein [Aliarcobacter cryaerophilus]